MFVNVVFFRCVFSMLFVLDVFLYLFVVECFDWVEWSGFLCWIEVENYFDVVVDCYVVCCLVLWEKYIDVYEWGYHVICYDIFSYIDEFVD